MLEEQLRKIQYRSHPWHGLSLGEHPPEIVNCYVEIVPTDTVKYELDKTTGILKVDRPQKYSSLCPSLYGFLPKTYAGDRVAEFCMEKTGRKNLEGDGDPLDICILTEKAIVRGDLIVKARPIGGFRLLDGNQVDDKIISVMIDDLTYGEIEDVEDCPEGLITRLRHYFLTYMENPDCPNKNVEITHIYKKKEAHQIIEFSHQDYVEWVEKFKD